MPKSNFGYISAGGVAGVQRGLEELLAQRFEQQQLEKAERLAREKAWEAGLERQRTAKSDAAKLDLDTRRVKLSEAAEARAAAADAKPRMRLLENVMPAGAKGPVDMTVPEDEAITVPKYLAPVRPSAGFGEALARAEERLGRKLTQPEEDDYFRRYSLANDPIKATGAGTPKPATGQQQKWMGFYQQMSAANKIIDRTEAALTTSDLFWLNTAGLEGPKASAAYYMLSDAGKSYARAMTEFLEAGLRDASGAQFNKTEFPVRGAIYMGHLADTPEARAERRASRQVAVQNAGRKAGPAYEQEYGHAYEGAEDALDAAPSRPAAAGAAPGTPPRRRVVTPADLAGPGPAAGPAPGAAPAPRRRKLVLGPDGLQEQPR